MAIDGSRFRARLCKLRFSGPSLPPPARGAMLPGMTDSRHPESRDDLLRLADDRLEKLCRIERRIGAGPGGQHRNRTQSAVVMSHPASGIRGFADDQREQSRNRAVALARLRLNLALEWRQPPPAAWPFAPEPPGRKARDYALWAAALLDVLAGHGWRVAETAGFCGLSTGRLVRLLARDEDLWQAVNRARAAAGQSVLRQSD